MASYLRYGDIAAVITAGNQLTTLGGTLNGQVTAQVGALRGKQQATIKGGDSYSTDFLAGYRKPHEGVNRDEGIFTGAAQVAEHASKIGQAVVLSATEVLYVDALNGAAMLRASSA